MDKIAALRGYNGKRVRLEGDAKEVGHVVIEGTLMILTVNGEERVYVSNDSGDEIYINVDEINPD